MKLTILGTGNAMVTKCYNTCFAIENDGHYFLVDGGGDNTIMKQLKNADIDWREITDVFVTHKHIDHIMGIIWIMRLFGQNIAEKGLDRELNIYGHEEVIHILHSMAELLLQKKHCAAIGKQIHMIKVKDGKENIIRKMNLPTNKPYLKIKITEGCNCSFFWSKNQKDWHIINTDKNGYNQLDRWDRVARPGLIHCGESDQPAEFSYFIIQ